MATVPKKSEIELKSGRKFDNWTDAGRALIWGENVIEEKDLSLNPRELFLKYREVLENISIKHGIEMRRLHGLIKHDLQDVKYRLVDQASGKIKKNQTSVVVSYKKPYEINLETTRNQYLDLWKTICFILSDNIKKNTDEKEFQKDVIRALERLGWDQYRGEIEEKPAIQVGSYRKIEPDIIVRSAETKQIYFVIEVKKPSVNSSREEIIDQLKSYMRQIKCELGIVIGNQITIFWDDRNSGHDDFTQLKQISFSENAAGEEFVKTFSKEGIQKRRLKEYIDNRITAIKQQKEYEKIRNYLTSDEFKGILMNQIGKDVCKSLTETNRNRVLEEISIEICLKTKNAGTECHDSNIDSYKSESEKDRSKYCFDGIVYNKRKLALAIIKKYVNDNPGISISRLESVFQKHLFKGHHQASRGVFTTVEIAQGSNPYRFFLGKDEIIKVSDSTIAVSNQWAVKNITILIEIAKKIGFDISRAE